MEKRKQPDEFRFHPAVFAFENEYRIMTWVRQDMIFSVEVDREYFYDDSCGVLRSGCRVHKVSIPMDLLDRAKKYTVHYRTISDREPYSAKIRDEKSYTYPFFPVPWHRPVKIYQITDSHTDAEIAISCGSFWGKELNLLLLTGDIQSHTQTEESYSYGYQIASDLTQGQIPILYTRGNHDCRGKWAERFYDYTPFDHDRAYFKTQLGGIFFLCLDCGEDKPDTNEEYCKTTCFAAYRKKEERWLCSVLQEKSFTKEEHVFTRLIVSHTPFSFTKHPPFDIEVERYTRWLAWLKADYVPVLMISGHLHTAEIGIPGGQLDDKGQCCPVVIGSRAPFVDEAGNRHMICSAYLIEEKQITHHFTDENHNIVRTTVFPIENK